MDAQLICYCILILSGAFALLSLGLLFIRMSLAVKETTVLMTMLETTIQKVDHILDDVNHKMDMLNAPVELVSGIFSRGGMKSGLFGVLGFFNFFDKKKKIEKKGDKNEIWKVFSWFRDWSCCRFIVSS